MHLIDTGLETQTGGRVRRLRHVDRQRDVHAHLRRRRRGRRHRPSSCASTGARAARDGDRVRPPARFGGLDLEGDRVAEFTEKPQLGEGWINGGFFVFEPECPRLHRRRRRLLLEREPLERLAHDGQLVAYRHEGFWQPMDTLRDVSARDACGARKSRRGRCGSERRASGATGPSSSPAPPAWSAAGSSSGSLMRARTSSAWCATGCRRASCVRAGCARAGQGRPRRRPRPGAARAVARRVRDRHGLSPRGADDRRHRQPQPGLDVRDEHPGHLGAARSLPAQPAGQADRRRLVRQGLRRPGEAALRRGRRRCRARHPYDVSKSCADLIAQTLRRDATACRWRSRAAATSTAAAT